MDSHINSSHADLHLITDQLLSRARSDTALATALRRQARRVLAILGEEETNRPTGKPPRTRQKTPPAPDKLNRLMDWSRGAHRETGGQVLVEGAPLAPGPKEQYLELATVCRLGARAADWRARLLAGDDASPDEREQLVREASNAGTFLWPLLQDGNLSDNPADFRRLADVYLACAEALEAWLGFPLQRAGELMILIAESQSMIRVAAAQAGQDRLDDTAGAVYQWLRALAADIRVYIPRYMRPGQAADPGQAGDLRERVAELLTPVRADLPPPARMEDPGVTDDEDDEEDEPPTPEVTRARELLQHRTVALFCGDRRPEQQRKLREALELNDLLWEDVSGKYSGGDHAWIFNRPDLELVLIAVRWLSHSQSGNLAKLAARRGVPVVWLKGGYGVNRVAHDVLKQVSEQLAELA